MTAHTSYRQSHRLSTTKLSMRDLLMVPPFNTAYVHGLDGESTLCEVRSTDDPYRLLLIGPAGEGVATILGPSAQHDPGQATIRLRSDTELLDCVLAFHREAERRTRQTESRAHEILDALTQAEVRGAELRGIIELLARLVDSPVILKGPDHRVQAWAGDTRCFDEARHQTIRSGEVAGDLLELLRSDGVLEKLNCATGPFRVEHPPDMVPRIVCPIRAGNVYYGYVSIAQGNSTLSELEEVAIRYATNVIALHLARDRAVEDSLRAQRGLLLYDLIYNNPTPDVIRPRAEALGVDLSKEAYLVILRFGARRLPSDAQARSRLMVSIAGTLDATFKRLRLGGALIALEADQIVLLLPCPPEMLRFSADALIRDINAYHRLRPAVVGISMAARPAAGLAEQHRQALLAADVGGERTKREPKVVLYQELGAARLLHQLGPEAAESYVNEILGTDPGFRKLFMETFGALLAERRSKSAAARRLFLHENTVKYRLKKISAGTGMDLNAPDDFFALECAYFLTKFRHPSEAEPD